jgi:hypothetical protein
MYFWEDNHDRALEWAADKQQRGQIAEPAVIGALLNGWVNPCPKTRI